VKNKEREDVTSKKSAVSKQSSANSPLKSEKNSKIAEEDINSNKS